MDESAAQSICTVVCAPWDSAGASRVRVAGSLSRTARFFLR